jgi:hypothetical protein
MTTILLNVSNYLPPYTASYLDRYGDGKFKPSIISFSICKPAITLYFISGEAKFLLLGDAANDVTAKLRWTGLFTGEFVENYSFR